MKEFRLIWLQKKMIIIFLLAVYVLSLINPLLLQNAYASAVPSFSVIKEDHFQVAPGVNHSSYNLSNQNNMEAVNMMEIDPKNPSIGLEVTSPKGKVVALDTVRNQSKQIDREGNRVIGAFNSDFYNTDPNVAGVPNGIQITNGEMITAPQTSRSVLAVLKDGSITIKEQAKMTGTVQVSGVNDVRPIIGINRPQTTSQTSSLNLYTSKFSTSTKTSMHGVEVILNPIGTIKSNQPINTKVEAVNEASNSSIPEGKWVLSGTGSNAEWLRTNLAVGKDVTFQFNMSQGLDEAVHAVSGGVTLVRDGQPTQEALQDNVERHPRTFVSIKQGKLYVTTFDGRQPTYSDGITIAEGAKYLAEQGMEIAINMDGGGSTTYGVRLPGDQTISVINKPSDGFERSNSNSLMVVSKEPSSELAKLVPFPRGKVKILAGSTINFNVKGQDQFFNGVPVDPSTLKWESDSSIGTVDQAGKFTAGSNTAGGSLKVSSGSVSVVIPVEVIGTLTTLTIAPNPAIINPGQKQQFNVKGFDEKENEVFLSQDQLKWETEGNIGDISSGGELTAANGTQSGFVRASFGNAKAEASVNIGKPPVVLEDFEDITDLTSSSARANNVKLDLMSRSNPVRVGTHSAQLSYDFIGTIGTSAAYVNFKDDDGNIGRLLEDRPTKLGLWVYGDGKNHWLRAVIQDGNGKNITLNLTEQGKLNWEGWKYVSADIPADTATPIKMKQLYIVETSNANKTKGAVVFDQLRAIYSDTGEDITGPVFSNIVPANGKRIYSNTPSLSALVRDEGKGVDPGSIIMTLDGKSASYQYNHETGVISFKPEQPLADGEHHVEIEATDLAGNPALPKADWKFTVFTGEDVDKPVINILSPAEGIKTRTDRPRIAAKIFDAYKGINLAKIKLNIDGKDEAYQFDQASGTVYFTSGSALKANSSHTVKLTAEDNSGNAAVKEWTFQVGAPLGQPKNANQFQMSIIGDGGYYTAGQGNTAADILLREQISRINQEPSELVGYTGDIVENDTPENFKTGLENMNLFKLPFIVSIGNHEISGTNSRENYQKAFGEPTYFYDYGNSRIIGLDSANGGITGSDASQWPWLEETLKEASEKNILLFMHVPPDEISPSGEDYNTGHGFSNAVESKRFYDVMGSFKKEHPDKNIMVVSGDLHAYQHKNVQGVDYIISGGGGKYTHIPAEKGGYYHYLNLKISNNSISWEVVPLLDRIEPKNSEVTVNLSDEAELDATGHFLTSTNEPISLPMAAPFKMVWSSSDARVVSVDSTGTITALSPGEATIHLQSGWKEAEFKITVQPSKVLEAIAKAESLSIADLRTQDLITSAAEAIQYAESLVANLKEGLVKTQLMGRLQESRAKVESAQTELYVKNAVSAIEEAEKTKAKEAIDKAEQAISVIENGERKETLQSRLQEVKIYYEANGLIEKLKTGSFQTKEEINKSIEERKQILQLINILKDDDDKKVLRKKMLQAEEKIVFGMIMYLAQKQHKHEAISDLWLNFLVEHALQVFAPEKGNNKDRLKAFVMKIVKEDSTAKKVEEAIEKNIQ